MNPITGASSFYLKNNELTFLKTKALKGDAEAAFRVYEHYEMVTGDIISGFPWLQIAASKGDLNAQYTKK